MEKYFLLTFIAFLESSCIFGQNLQLHYDFGEGRHFFTSTLEMFKPDSLGSTFWFVDFDFNSPDKPRGISMAYWEMSRDFYIPGIKKLRGFEELGFHIEYNDGVQIEKPDSGEITGFNLNSTWLAGFSYPVKIGNVIIGTMLLYKHPRAASSADFQLTAVWYQPVFKNRIILTGFLDVWSQDKIYEDGKEIVFQTEPQCWYAFHRKMFVGSEIKISKNFPFGPDDWKFLPTIAVKWEF
ncbi:MAG: hypothetical protein A2Y71_01050 [Bacteroidetes bacterium RBG_13_42_15]|nr:MAG: hypothetical protein A2Y71_01050 [Bacteroidetes bacterium RBG_13_42_15]HJX71649.1 DUF5020 family protein [Bacteroidales bacterium]